ncbi:MAG: carbamoyltransferase HypF [Candidatus Omnitrophica bacterium]|nr:carbamoyltransferase HypF [Candidatus Omnitrophota bacterium]
MVYRSICKIKEKCETNELPEGSMNSSLDKIIKLPFSFKDKVLAVGGQLKSTFCLAKDNRIFISKPFGDLEDIDTLSVFEKSIEDFKNQLKINPKIIAYDLHPEYLSTKYAQDYILQSSHCRLIAVQHHHAHIASCMADNNMKNQKVIGIAFDGTGFGNDGNLWGGEFLIADYRDFKRAAFFDYIPLVGGIQAIKQPWRMAAIYLYKTYKENFLKTNIDFIGRLDKHKWSILKKMIDRGINTPLTSSVGRLFDAISSLIGIRDKVEYEGQAAIELEKAIDADIKGGDSYKYRIDNKGVFIIDVRPIIKGVIEDLKKGYSKGRISIKFHNTIVEIILDICKRVRENSKINKVALSGGVFQNKYLYRKTIDYLTASNFKILTHRIISTTDAGICLGQAVIAQFMRK